MACAAPSPLHWEDLRNRSQETILQQEGVRPAKQGHGYEISFLDASFLVDPQAESIVELSPDPDRRLTEEFQILLIRYLVGPNGGPLEGKDISEKDLPGGLTFFQGPHALQVEPITRLYGEDPEGFEVRGRALNGVPVPYGDKAIRFLPFPLMPVTYVLWRADEEFPAAVTVLFDKSIPRWFELDMIFTLVLALTDRIVDNRPRPR
jgi:hypothetical protein